MPADRPLTGREATLAIARIAVTRAPRSWALWVVLALASLPVAYARLILGSGPPGAGLWRDVFSFGLRLLWVVPTTMVAGAIGDELTDRHRSYLWSRPLPRWSILTGKLLASAPLAFAVLAGGLAAAFALARSPALEDPGLVLARSLGAIALGVIAVGAVATAMATLQPRFATALAIGYMGFVDFPLGEMPAALRQLSIQYQVRQVAAVDQYPGSTVTALIALAVITAVAAAVALARVRRFE